MFSGIVFVTLVTFFIKHAIAITEAQKLVIHEKFLLFGTQCMEEHPLSADDLISFKQRQFPEGENAPCFTACVFRKLGLINDKGSYSYDAALESTKEVFAEEDQNNFRELLGTCDKVNEEEVTDGEDGCIRSKSAYNCLKDRAPEYGFDVNI